MFSDLSFTEIIYVLISLIISIALHEAMHAYVAHFLGDDTAFYSGRLTLNPLKHVDLVTTVLFPMILILVGLPPLLAAKPVPINIHNIRYGDYGTALVGIAGPLTNFVLAAIGSGVYRGMNQPSNAFGDFLYIFIIINIGFFVFNMIPFPPLDGSRLLYAFAPEGIQEFMQRIESFGFLSILVFFFLVFQVISGVITNIEQYILEFLL